MYSIYQVFLICYIYHEDKVRSFVYPSNWRLLGGGEQLQFPLQMWTGADICMYVHMTPIVTYNYRTSGPGPHCSIIMPLWSSLITSMICSQKNYKYDGKYDGQKLHKSYKHVNNFIQNPLWIRFHYDTSVLFLPVSYVCLESPQHHCFEAIYLETRQART